MRNFVLWAAAFVAAAGLASGQETKTEPAKVAGKWELTRQFGDRGPFTSNVTFEQDGETLKGTITGRRGDSPLTGKVTGKEITFSFSMQGRDGETRTLEYKGTVDGDSMKGETETPRGKSEWTAKRAAATEAAPPAAEPKPAN